MDDEVVGCSGTILLNRESILELIVVYFTDDVKRIIENNSVGDKMRINKQYNLHLKDGFVAQGYEDGVCQLINIVQKEHPDIVFIPHSKDAHVDHIATHNIAMDALNKARYWKTEYDFWSPEYVFEYEVWSFLENVSEVVDISAVFEQKLELMSMYQSQLKDYDYLNYIQYINGYRGLLYNKNGKAECFMLRKV